MAKAKRRNKKDVDFQKVKLKVGRKLKRDSNETKAQFASRKIILKEVKNYSDDPLTALSRHSDHISQHGKLSLINHFNSALTPAIVKSLNKPIIDSLAKFIIDHSEQVRTATFRCLKTCFNHIKQQHLSTREFIYLLKPYLDCAYTHISRGVANDCQKFLEYLTNINDSQIFEPLMPIVLRRYEAGNLSLAEKNLALKLKHFYMRHKRKQSLEDMSKCYRTEPVCWTESDFLLDLDVIVHDLDSKRREDYVRDVLLVPKLKAENIVEEFLSKVREEGEGVAQQDNA